MVKAQARSEKGTGQEQARRPLSERVKHIHILLDDGESDDGSFTGMAAGYPQYSSGGGGGGSGSTGGSYSNTRYGNSNGNIGSSKDSQGMQGSLAAGSTYSNGIAPSAYASSSVQSGGNSASAGSSSRPAQNSPEEIELSRRTAKVHYDEFKAYLEQENHRGQSGYPSPLPFFPLRNQLPFMLIGRVLNAIARDHAQPHHSLRGQEHPA